MKAQTNNAVFVNDTHCACQLGLMSPKGIQLKGGQRVMPSKFQKWLWDNCWMPFWFEFVPIATENEPFDLVFNGDMIDNRHHGTTSLVTSNLAEQERIFTDCMDPVLAIKNLRRRFAVGGTDAHAGISAENEEKLAKAIGAEPDELGNLCRSDLWLAIGTKGHKPGLVHALHHIGTTGSAAYETTALHREYVEACQEAARWRLPAPDVIVRAHRHRYAKTEVQSGNGNAIVVVSPGWQGKTPWTFKLAGARQSIPQFGGVVVRSGDLDIYTRARVFGFRRSRTE